MVPVKAADRRDPGAGRNSLCPSRKSLLNVVNGECILERRMVAGPIPHEHNVIVIVDDARYRRASLQINGADSRPTSRGGTADGPEPAVSNRYRLHNGVVAIHRVNSAVDQHEFLECAGGSLLGRRKGGGHSHRRRDAPTDTRAEELPA